MSLWILTPQKSLCRQHSMTDRQFKFLSYLFSLRAELYLLVAVWVLWVRSFKFLVCSFASPPPPFLQPFILCRSFSSLYSILSQNSLQLIVSSTTNLSVYLVLSLLLSRLLNLLSAPICVPGLFSPAYIRVAITIFFQTLPLAICEFFGQFICLHCQMSHLVIMQFRPFYFTILNGCYKFFLWLLPQNFLWLLPHLELQQKCLALPERQSFYCRRSSWSVTTWSLTKIK